MNKIMSLIKKYKWDLIIYLIPFISFGFMLYIYYPGIFNYDVFAQLAQIKNNSFNTAHPFISTFYLMIFNKLFVIKSAVALFQIIWFSILWCMICHYNRKKESKLVLVLQIIVTVLMSFNPIISTSIISSNKDTLFLLIFMTICFLLQKIIDKKFNADFKLYIALAFFLVFFRNVRHNGLYTNLVFIPILLLVMIVYLFKNNKKIIIIFSMSLCVFSFLFKLPNKIFNVYEIDEGINGPGALKALQLEGYLYNNQLLTEKEVKTLSKYVSMESLSAYSYNYTFQDLMLSVEKTEYYGNHIDEFLHDSIMIALNHKRDSIKFYHISSTIVWDIVVPDNSIHNYLWLWIDVQNTPKEYKYINKNTSLFKFVDINLNKSINNHNVIALFYSPATYMYLSILLSIAFIILKKKEVLIITIFNLINVLIISISIPIQDARYLLNNFGLFYLLVIIFISTLNFRNKCEKN